MGTSRPLNQWDNCICPSPGDESPWQLHVLIIAANSEYLGTMLSNSTGQASTLVFQQWLNICCDSTTETQYLHTEELKKANTNKIHITTETGSYLQYYIKILQFSKISRRNSGDTWKNPFPNHWWSVSSLPALQKLQRYKYLTWSYSRQQKSLFI